MLLENDKHNQLGFEAHNHNQFTSNLGKTVGALAPSEYGYFWRNYFHFSNSGFLNEQELEKVKSNEFLRKLSAFEILTSKPLVMKGMILNWNIPYLQSIFDKFIFIDLKRDIKDNAYSLLKARSHFFKDEKKWYSFKPIEYPELVNKSPIEQVVGQVYYTQKAIQDGLKKVPDRNKISISYAEFCDKPERLLTLIQNRFEQLGYHLELADIPSASFHKSQGKIPHELEPHFDNAYTNYVNP